MGQVKSFNLIEEPWIICRTDDGTQKLSIRQVFDALHVRLRSLEILRLKTTRYCECFWRYFGVRTSTIWRRNFTLVVLKRTLSGTNGS